MLFSRRVDLEQQYYQWVKTRTEDGAEKKDCPFNVIVFLDSLGLFKDAEAGSGLLDLTVRAHANVLFSAAQSAHKEMVQASEDLSSCQFNIGERNEHYVGRADKAIKNARSYIQPLIGE